MSAIYNEGSLRFEFAEGWTVVKYDETPEYARVRDQTNAKGVDFVALAPEGDDRFALHLIEVKDFRGHRIENVPRIREGELALEVAQKVRDTVAGTIGAQRTSADPQTWARMSRTLKRGRDVIRIVLWLERDRAPARGTEPRRRSRGQRGKTELSVLTQALKTKSSWLTSRVLATDRDGGLEGVTAMNLQTGGSP